ncbi:uncharacterized protein MELLADRAFT_77887 [Melampsora larici-populina 98AG31]|uniref:C2H2-type domain-containing protein n=1 Tax=Melampsora larici-populina (strain 98AG31 / pathotype 3-4-7) TaxID=747676 RepID=F4RMY4_MELLP|nr:uncharacterized protein MELLADRAFT_77887 [Melampsora larici-populina 98AG31]EGG06198.1 hypothetical protein MELLADRAFT_77887 [Melampsora larici-populina 98AG31]
MDAVTSSNTQMTLQQQAQRLALELPQQAQQSQAPSTNLTNSISISELESDLSDLKNQLLNQNEPHQLSHQSNELINELKCQSHDQIDISIGSSSTLLSNSTHQPQHSSSNHTLAIDPNLSNINPINNSQDAFLAVPTQSSSVIKEDSINHAFLSLNKYSYGTASDDNTSQTNTLTKQQPLLTSEMVEHSLTPLRVGKKWACRICYREFTRRFNCTTHERTHLDLNERAQYRCGLCPRGFTRRHDLERHVHSVHPGHMLEKESSSSSSPSQPITIVQTASVSPKRKSNDHILTDATANKIRKLESPEWQQHHESGSDQQLRILVEPRSASTSTNPFALLLPHQDGPAPTAILTAGSIRDISTAVERIALEILPSLNPNNDPIFKFEKKWACGTCGRLFVRRNNCKAHELTHRDIREYQCATCSRSFSRRHDLERHITAVHPDQLRYPSHTESEGEEQPEAQEEVYDQALLPRSPTPPPPPPSPPTRPRPCKAEDKTSLNIFETLPGAEPTEAKEESFDPSLFNNSGELDDIDDEKTLLEKVQRFVWGSFNPA